MVYNNSNLMYNQSMKTKYTIEQAYTMTKNGMDCKDGWHTMCNGEWGNTYRYKTDAEAAFRAEGLVQDRKTKEWYDPKEAFDTLMNTPEIMASMQRLAIR